MIYQQQRWHIKLPITKENTCKRKKTFWYKRKILSKAQQARELSSFANVTAQRAIKCFFVKQQAKLHALTKQFEFVNKL